MRRAYFAYGMNMDIAHMRALCPGAVPMRRARLDGWRFQMTARRIATIVRAPAEFVFGATWSIAADDEARLDRFEGVAAGHYYKVDVTVLLESQDPHDAFCYVANPDLAGPPPADVLPQILQGSLDWRLPADYRAMLASWN